MPEPLPQANQTEAADHRLTELLAAMATALRDLSEVEPPARLDEALQLVVNLFACPAGELLVWDEAGQRWRQVGLAGRQQAWLNGVPRVESELEILREALQTKQFQTGPLVARAPQLSREKVKDLARLRYLGWPLVVSGQVKGLLGLVTARPFTASELHALTIVARPVALLLTGPAAESLAPSEPVPTAYTGVERRRTALRELNHRLTERVEAERRRLSRELHDQAGQSLTAILIRLDLILEQLAAPELRQQVAEVTELVQQTIDELRRLARDLRPSVLDDLGLEEALRLLAAQLSGGSLSITLSGDRPFPRLPSPIETALYRITQEALNNVVKHAQATVAAVRLQSEPQRVQLEIKDNGRGFDAAAKGDQRDGIGLLGMMERTESLGGHLKVSSRPGRGTLIKVEIPL